MHSSKIAVFGAIMISLMILMTAFQLSSHNFYHVPSSNSNETEVEQVETVRVLSKSERKEVECLAQNIYYEAAGEPRLGWLAVASVTMNRLISGNYASSVCGVVHQKTGSTYQFSWVGMRKRLSSINEEVYNEVLEVATTMYLNYDPSWDVTKGATFYHADYVNPGWKHQKVKKIGRHIFYRSKKDSESLGVM